MTNAARAESAAKSITISRENRGVLLQKGGFGRPFFMTANDVHSWRTLAASKLQIRRAGMHTRRVGVLTVTLLAGSLFAIGQSETSKKDQPQSQSNGGTAPNPQSTQPGSSGSAP